MATWLSPYLLEALEQSERLGAGMLIDQVGLEVLVEALGALFSGANPAVQGLLGSVS